MKNLEVICLKGVLQVLLNLGIEGQSLGNLNELRGNLGIIDKYNRLFETLLQMLIDKDYIFEHQGAIAITRIVKEDLSTFNFKEALAREVLDNNDSQAHANLVAACIESFAQILTGKCQATDIIFPYGSRELVSGIYKGNQQADYFNNILSQFIKSTIENSVPLLEEGNLQIQNRS